MSFFKSKKDLDDERRARQAKEAQEALGEIEIPILMDHNYDDLVAADAIAAARAAAREQARAARAAEIAAEIPEAQVARKLWTEYWEKLDAHRKIHAPRGYYPTAELFGARPHGNIIEVYQACRAAADAYQALGNMEKSQEYADYASGILGESRMGYSVGGKKTRYSRKY